VRVVRILVYEGPEEKINSDLNRRAVKGQVEYAGCTITERIFGWRDPRPPKAEAVLGAFFVAATELHGTDGATAIYDKAAQLLKEAP